MTSSYVFGMLMKYWLSPEGGFVGGERVNPVSTCTPKHTHLRLDHSPGFLHGA